jgi:hypothetical protein
VTYRPSVRSVTDQAQRVRARARVVGPRSSPVTVCPQTHTPLEGTPHFEMTLFLSQIRKGRSRPPISTLASQRRLDRIHAIQYKPFGLPRRAGVTAFNQLCALSVNLPCYCSVTARDSSSLCFDVFFSHAMSRLPERISGALTPCSGKWHESKPGVPARQSLPRGKRYGMCNSLTRSRARARR